MIIKTPALQVFFNSDIPISLTFKAKYNRILAENPGQRIFALKFI